MKYKERPPGSSPWPAHLLLPPWLVCLYHVDTSGPKCKLHPYTTHPWPAFRPIVVTDPQED